MPPTISSLLQRLIFLTGILSLEVIGASIWLDTAALSGISGVTGLIADYASPMLRSILASTAFFAILAYFSRGSAFQSVSSHWIATPIRWSRLAAHFGWIAVFVGVSIPLFGGRLSAAAANSLIWIWIGTGFTAVALAGSAVIPPSQWLKIARGAGWIWSYSVAAGILVWFGARLNQPIWKISTALTFQIVRLLLNPVLPQVFADPASESIGSPRFHVEISAACSGIEGAMLMVVFGSLWLWFFRKESRFPQALLLIPAGVAILWALNALRIAALILIGNAGAPSVALGGFHSQAGWISFNVVALGFAVALRRLPWINLRPVEPLDAGEAEKNPAIPYLAPFLLILAAALISRSLSSGFELLYPLRFFAAGLALWSFRRRYAQLDWTFSLAGPVAGVIVFAMWMFLDRGAADNKGGFIAVGIFTLPLALRVAWLTFRTLAAITTVPIAEELAFRAFLIRRLQAADFESLSVKSFSWVSLIASSVAFGLLHGDRWLAGALAGLIYSGVYLRWKFGDAVVAHATTNALLAGLVLLTGRWDLW